MLKRITKHILEANGFQSCGHITIYERLFSKTVSTLPFVFTFVYVFSAVVPRSKSNEPSGATELWNKCSNLVL